MIVIDNLELKIKKMIILLMNLVNVENIPKKINK